MSPCTYIMRTNFLPMRLTMGKKKKKPFTVMIRMEWVRLWYWKPTSLSERRGTKRQPQNRGIPMTTTAMYSRKKQTKPIWQKTEEKNICIPRPTLIREQETDTQ